GAVLFDFLTDEGTELTTGKRFLLIDLRDHLGVRGQELVTRNPGVIGSHHRCPLLVLLTDIFTQNKRTLILIRVLELATRVNANDSTLAALNLEDLVHGLLIIFGDNLVGTIHSLPILASLESPLDVFRGSLVQMVIDMSER